ncbi:MAG: F0F1 ATP synthase subunit epsilon [Gammaproteobacteria bacterium]|nr:F0F1 ATP synthase subunit epsilon [Gammaproteobacteria bacterium]
MSMSIHLDIVSAEKEIFSGLVQSVVATGALGELGVMLGHTPLLTSIRPGEVRLVKLNGDVEVIYISGGFLEVQPAVVTILADAAERAEELDEAAAREAQKVAQSRIAQKTSELEYSKALAELAQAAAQLRAIGKLRSKHR